MGDANGMDVDVDVDWQVDRVVAELHTSDRFRQAERQFTRQYAQLYYQRAATLKPAVKASASTRWPDVRFVNKVLDIPTTEVCFVIGTIYADLPLKPNILDEITEERYLVKPPPRPKYVSDKDKFVLEDESGRVTLVGDKVSQETLVTGVVVAVLGIQQGGGELLVHDICFAGVAPQKPLPSTSEDTFVALVSGLHIGAATTGPSSPKILVDYLTGCLGGPADQERAAKIAHVIIAGNSLTSVGSDNAAAAAVAVAVAVAAAAATSANGDDKMDAVGSSSSENTAQQQQQQVLGKKSSTPDSHAIPLGPMVELDQLLVELAESVSVDMMPGERDPSNHSLPQQPLFASLLPYSSSMSTFRLVTNPYDITINGVHIVGTSGQNLDDIYKYVTTEDRLQIAEGTLHWRHMAPTAPDTLACLPFFESDPFVFDSTPHVYFIGNQPSFAQKLVRDPDTGVVVKIVLVPSFARTGEALILNLRTLDVYLLKTAISL